MTGDVSEHRSVSATEEWPTFALSYTFNPERLAGRDRIAPDELVVFDSAEPCIETAWITAERGSYVSIEDTR